MTVEQVLEDLVGVMAGLVQAARVRRHDEQERLRRTTRDDDA